MVENFEATLTEFVSFCQNLSDTHMEKNYPSLAKEQITVRPGQRYAKLVKNGSAFCFVDRENGNVLKAASWNAPAKGARGNIFIRDSWKFMSPYGAAYLR